MKKMKFEKAQFLTSAIEEKDLVRDENLMEIAIVGRSNVGKSSLLNHLLRQKKLAKTSSKPGKTQLINFFKIDDSFFIVDLPGYGYAKIKKSIQSTFSKSIEYYLKNSKKIKLILFLLDIRREPNESDMQFIDWASYYGIPVLAIFTKTDKVKESILNKNTKSSLDILQKDSKSLPYIHYSIHNLCDRKKLIEKINSLIKE